MEFTCAICGKHNDDIPTCFGADAPWREMGVLPDEFDNRVELNDDLCVVDGKTFFIRGHIELPIISANQLFMWSVWCSLSEESFEDANTHWEDVSRDGNTYFGWLCTALPCYETNSVHLKTDVRMREIGVVPQILIHETNHQLYVEQQDGISVDRYHQIIHELLHSDEQST